MPNAAGPPAAFLFAARGACGLRSAEREAPVREVEQRTLEVAVAQGAQPERQDKCAERQRNAGEALDRSWFMQHGEQQIHDDVVGEVRRVGGSGEEGRDRTQSNPVADQVICQQRELRWFEPARERRSCNFGP